MLDKSDKDYLESKFKSVNSNLKKIKDSLDLAIGTFDKQLVYHHKRLMAVEKKSGLEEQPPTPPVN